MLAIYAKSLKCGLTLQAASWLEMSRCPEKNISFGDGRPTSSSQSQ